MEKSAKGFCEVFVLHHSSWPAAAQIWSKRLSMLFNTCFSGVSGACQKKVKSGFILGAIVWGMWNDLPGWDLKLVMDSGHANPSQTSHPKPRPLVKNVPCELSSIGERVGELSSRSAFKSPEPWDVSWTVGNTLATAGFFLSIFQCQCILIPWKQI